MLSPQELEQHTHHVSLGSPFFELLEVLVSGPPKEDFEALGIRQVEATFTYGEPGEGPEPETQTLLFRPDSTGDKTVAFQRNGRKSLAYRAALTYDFARGGADADSVRYELPPEARTGRSMAINPTADFGALEVDVELGRVHADVRAVDVDLTYVSPDGKFTAKEHFRLIPGGAPGGAATGGAAPGGTAPGGTSPAGSAMPAHWLVRTRSERIGSYTAVPTFTFDDGAWTAPAITSSERLLEIDTPFAGERELTIKPVLPSGATVERFTIEVEYDDEAAGYHRRKTVVIQPPFETAQISIPVPDRNKRRIRYRVTVQEPGMVGEGDWEMEEGPSITIGAEAHKVGRVKIQLVGPALEAAGLDGVQVRLLPVAEGQPAPPIDEAINVLFTGTTTSETADLTLPPGAPLRYRYQTTSFHKDGTTKESEWKETGTTLLVLQVVNL
ncbi:MAG: hypothetical protein QUU85_17480 [Candidatus Eisenbacteria bacterium]|nr:hypothetical protein [Candidatus Eisenbacteria bacterium]